MKLDIYAKHRTGETEDGRKYDFYSYTTKLKKKDGDVVTASVKFVSDGKEAPKGKECPCAIIVKRNDMNLATQDLEYRDENGNITGVKRVYTLWIRDYELTEYVDHSLDDFDVDD